MTDNQARSLKFTNRVAPAICIMGMLVVLISFFTTDMTADYILYSGIGVVISSVFLYMFGLVLALVEEKGHTPVIED